MDREQFLQQLFPLIGGKDNTSLCEFQRDSLYVTLKVPVWQRKMLYRTCQVLFRHNCAEVV